MRQKIAIAFFILPFGFGIKSQAQERLTLPLVSLFNEGFTNRDLLESEKLLITAENPRLKRLNQVWGWPPRMEKLDESTPKERLTFEQRLHKHESAIYSYLTPYSDMLFRFFASQLDGHPTFLLYDFNTKLDQIGQESLSSIPQESRGILVQFLGEYLARGENKALLTQFANFEIRENSSLYFTLGVLSARAFLFLSEAKFDRAYQVIERAREIMDIWDRKNQRGRGDAGSDGDQEDYDDDENENEEADSRKRGLSPSSSQEENPRLQKTNKGKPE